MELPEKIRDHLLQGGMPNLNKKWININSKFVKGGMKNMKNKNSKETNTKYYVPGFI